MQGANPCPHNQGKDSLDRQVIISGCSAVGSAGALGASGREFKSHHSDHKGGRKNE